VPEPRREIQEEAGERRERETMRAREGRGGESESERSKERKGLLVRLAYADRCDGVPLKVEFERRCQVPYHVGRVPTHRILIHHLSDGRRARARAQERKRAREQERKRASEKERKRAVVGVWVGGAGGLGKAVSRLNTCGLTCIEKYPFDTGF